VFSVDGSTGPAEAAKLDAAAFKALKPGGVFVVVDHAAAPGSGDGMPIRCIASIRR
jgi:predicted methyltransferase